jgi:hypothetical protein
MTKRISHLERMFLPPLALLPLSLLASRKKMLQSFLQLFLPNHTHRPSHPE